MRGSWLRRGRISLLDANWGKARTLGSNRRIESSEAVQERETSVDPLGDLPLLEAGGTLTMEYIHGRYSVTGDG